MRGLGAFEGEVAGVPLRLGGARQRVGFATLVAHANTAVSLDRLSDVVWGDAPPRTADRTLQKYVHRLRLALAGPGIDPTASLIETRAAGYLLAVEPGWVDAHRFATLVSH